MFFGRKNELNIINKLLDTEKFESLVLRGKRRVGKTTLLKEIYNNFDGTKIFHVASDNGVDICIERFWKSIADGLNIKFKLTEIEDILRFIFDASTKEKILFVIDEYPYLRNNIKYFDSLLQTYIDSYKEKSKMKLIICGSYINVMKDIVSHSNPLFRRFSYEMTLKDLNYLEASYFYSNYSLEDKVKTYSVFGGNPFYNSFIDSTLSFEENIINFLNTPFLLDSPIRIYEDEITNIGGVNYVFNQISKGNHKYTDLASSKVRTSNLPYLLDPIIDMGLIRKEVPINDLNSKKKTFYYINDNFLDFYYRYIDPNQTLFLTLDKKKFFNTYIKEDLEKYYIPKKFELLCKEAIIHMNINNLNGINYKGIGKYWCDDPKSKTNREFDIACINYDDSYTFFEVKFSNNPINDSVVNKKEFQIESLGISNYKLGFVSKSGFDLKNKDNYVLFTLRDLYLEKNDFK